MYTLANNVLGRLKYDIAGGAASLVVEPLAGTALSLPPAPTSAAGSTYGEPYGVITLMDRLDASVAKIEHILYDARAAEAGGAYTLSGLVRGQEGSAAQAWVAGAYVLQQATDEVLQARTPLAALRAGLTVVHKRTATLPTWDGTSFKFDTFRFLGAGRGRHFSTGGFFDVTMPPNGTVVTGFGGASNQNVAAGAIPMPVDTVLWYEPSIGAGTASINGNFKLTSWSADVQVPPHWLFIAAHAEYIVGADKCLRVCDGSKLFPWHVIGAGGEPAFQNAWVNIGAGFSTAAFRRDASGLVQLKGVVKDGTAANTIFTLPVGFRPLEITLRGTTANAAFGYVQVTVAGLVQHQGGSTTNVSLDGIAFFPDY